MGSKHSASGSTSSAIAGPSSSSRHVKRRSGSGVQHSSTSPAATRAGLAPSITGGNSNYSNSLYGLGLEQDKGKAVERPAPHTSISSRSRRSSPSRSASFHSGSSSAGYQDWSSTSAAVLSELREAERGSSIDQERTYNQSSSTKNTPTSKLRRSTSSTPARNDHTSATAPWMTSSSPSWTSPERRPLSTVYSEDSLMMDSLHHSPQGYTSPYRSPAGGIPSLYRSSPSASSSSSISFYRSDSMPMIASTSQSSLYESTLSPSASFSTLSPSKSPSFDSRRNLETTLSIAPSPPMPSSSSFQPHHLSSPNSLTNRTSPKSGPHTRDESLSSSCMPVSSSTSSFFASARRVNSADLARDGKSDARTVPAFKHDQSRQARWRNFNWKARKRSPSDDADPVSGKQTLRDASRLGRAIASAFLGPFFPLVFPEQATMTSHRNLSKSSSGQNRHLQASPHRRWQSRAFRLLLGLYIFYSLFLFTSRLLNLSSFTPPTSSTSRLRISELNSRSLVADVNSDYSKWQQARFKLLDVYNVAADAIGSTAARIGRQSSKAAAGDFAGDSNGATSLNNLMLLDRLPEVRRRWGETSNVRNPTLNPLTSFSNEYRFSKMFSKIDASTHEQTEPFLFQAEPQGQAGDVTACLYLNDAWVSQLPVFMERWRGPVSIVYELAENNTSPDRLALIQRLQDLRERHPLIKQFADIHAVYNNPQTDLQARRLNERLILRPVASNFQLNIARFFAKTDMVWLVSDARILPAPNLRQQLNDIEEVRSYTMDFADAIIVPTFGAARRLSPNSTRLPLLAEVRASIGLGGTLQDGVDKKDFDKLSKAYVSAHFDSIPLDPKDWPSDKKSLVGLSSSRPPSSLLPEHLQGAEGPIFTLFDRRWEAGKGPTSFSKWKAALYEAGKHTNEDHSTDSPTMDNGFYEVIDYDLHYAPSLVIGRDRQPWCTERFEYNRAACIYQMYLQGANKWVLPTSWAYTVEQTDKHAPKEPKNDAEKLKAAVQSRLYTKFFSEACMHYGRAFLSNDLWDSERAQHLRYSCARVLNTYGIGMSVEEEAAAAKIEEDNKKAQKKKKKKQKQK